MGQNEKMALLVCLKGPKRPKKGQKHFFVSDYSITPLKRLRGICDLDFRASSNGFLTIFDVFFKNFLNFLLKSEKNGVKVYLLPDNINKIKNTLILMSFELELLKRNI